MKLKAIVYDTNNIDRSPREIIVRNVYCDKNGKPQRIGSQNGMQYKDFELIDEESPKEVVYDMHVLDFCLQYRSKLSGRAYNCMRKAGKKYKTVRQALAGYESVRNFGEKSYNEIQQLIDEL